MIAYKTKSDSFPMERRMENWPIVRKTRMNIMCQHVPI